MSAEPVELGPEIPFRVPVSLASVVVNQGPSRTHHTSQHTRPPHGQDRTQGRTGLSPTAVLDASRARVSPGQVHGQGEGHPTAAIPPGTAALVTRSSPAPKRALGTQCHSHRSRRDWQRGPPASTEASGPRKHLLHNTLFGD